MELMDDNVISTSQKSNTNIQEISPVELPENEPGTESRTLNESKKNNWKMYRGLIYTILSSVFFSISSFIVKQTEEVSPIQLSLNASVGIFVFSIPFVIYNHRKFFGPKELRHLLVLRGLIGAANVYLRFLAFRYLPLSEGSVIVSTVPVFVVIFARIILKEPCKIIHIIVLCLTMIGIFLTTRIPQLITEGLTYNKEHIIGVLAATGSSLSFAIVYVLVRKVNILHYSVIIFNAGWVSIIELTIITFSTSSFGTAKCGIDQWLQVLLGISSFLTMALLTVSLQHDEAAPVAMVRGAMDILLSFFWQIFFFQEIPDGYSISGAILIFFCVVLIGLNKWILSIPKDSKMRKKLFFLTL